MSRQFIATYNRTNPSIEERYNALKNNQKLRGMPTGVVVATRNNEGKVVFGYAMCHPEEEIRFSKKRAVQIALGRALDEKTYPVPNGLNKTLTPEFIKRCETYFKEKNLCATLIKDKKTLNRISLSNVTVNNVTQLDGDYYIDRNGAIKNK